MVQVKRLTLCLVALCVAATLGLVGCTPGAPSVTATATLVPRSTSAATVTRTLPPSATSTPLPPTATLAATATPPPPTSTLPPPTSTPPPPTSTTTPTPAATATRTPKPTPTPFRLTTTPVPHSERSITAQNVFQVTELAVWETNRRDAEVVFSPDGRFFAITARRGIHLYDAETLEAVRVIPTETGAQGIAFSADGELVGAGRSLTAGPATVWRVSDGELVASIKLDPEHLISDGVCSVAFSPDSTMLAAGAYHGQVYLLRLADGEVIRVLGNEGDSEIRVAFSPDGSTVAAATDEGYVRMWRVADGVRVSYQDRGGHKEGDVAYSPDGSLLAAVTSLDQIDLWDGHDGAHLRTLIGHADYVICAAFSPDGSLLVSGGWDKMVRFWRVSDGALLHTLPGSIQDVAFSPDGRLVVSTSSDYGVRFWGIDPARPADEATPTPTAVPTSPAPEGPFHRIAGADGLPPGEIHDLWAAPDGDLWLVTQTGIYAYSDGNWRSLYSGVADRVLGADEGGCIWALLGHGFRIAAYTEDTWTIYGPDQGWQQGHAGKLVTDRQGGLWTVVGEEIRRFDPNAQVWSVVATADEAFGPLDEPVEPGRFLTDIVIDKASNVWVGSCTHSGIVIMGQGVRWFDGERWNGPGETEGQCVYDIEVDSSGRVWTGGFDALHVYDHAMGSWSSIALPPWERTQLVDTFALDEAGDPIVTFTRFGGAGPWHSTAIYALHDGTWVEVFDPGTDFPVPFFASAPDDAFWVYALGPIYRVADGERHEIGSVPCYYCERMIVDGSGRLWIAGEGSAGTSLWWYVPKE
jgi:WD40 repeat protein